MPTPDYIGTTSWRRTGYEIDTDEDGATILRARYMGRADEEAAFYIDNPLRGRRRWWRGSATAQAGSIRRSAAIRARSLRR